LDLAPVDPRVAGEEIRNGFLPERPGGGRPQIARFGFAECSHDETTGHDADDGSHLRKRGPHEQRQLTASRDPLDSHEVPGRPHAIERVIDRVAHIFQRNVHQAARQSRSPKIRKC
jgi:hypothetical protein